MSYDVVIVLGSESDLDKVKESKMLQVLNSVRVSWELSVISAHRHASDLAPFVKERNKQGTKVFIGIAGMAAALPGAIASLVDEFSLVFGVALSGSILDGVDALLSQVRMPKGRLVLNGGLDEAGLYNTALAACKVMALVRPELRGWLTRFVTEQDKPPVISLLASDKKEGGLR